MITDCRLVLQFGFVVVLGCSFFLLTTESKINISFCLFFSTERREKNECRATGFNNTDLFGQIQMSCM